MRDLDSPMPPTTSFVEVSHVPVAAVGVDRAGRIVEATNEAAAMLGVAADTLRGRTLGDLAADGWREMADAATSRILLGDGKPFQLLLKGRSGRRVLIEMVPGRASDNDIAFQVIAWSLRPVGEPPQSEKREQSELRRLAYDLLRAQEAERSRVAADLHSDVIPLVLMVKFMVEDGAQRVQQGDGATGLQLLADAVGRMRDVLNELRRISTELRPSLLDDLGLVPTLEWYCRTFESTYRSLQVKKAITATEADIPALLKVEIFRIVQEALSNVAQHARATHVRVALACDGELLKLSIEDNGIGFDAGQFAHGQSAGHGVGLETIRKRVDATRGRLTLDSRPRRGSSLVCVWDVRPHPRGT
jgi:two-component system NarL family sensor kinase